MNQPMTSAERRAYNQRRHAERRRELVAERGAQGVAELWWDQARKIARDRAARGDEGAWHDLALTLSNYCDRYSK
ncbi:hypothetical protein [Planobispora rosea]|uniref:hypothetical protein n=1 Tax=Planobispora rosea TaxID=35762 RepID=UPI001C3FFC77|nr:hypothetical protein [Planobispora rosea]